VRNNSPSGGFVRKDDRTGRWFRIKESEARDKVGHAIRKAVQRLEETKPKLAARLKKEYLELVAKTSPPLPAASAAASLAESTVPVADSPCLSETEKEQKEQISTGTSSCKEIADDEDVKVASAKKESVQVPTLPSSTLKSHPRFPTANVSTKTVVSRRPQGNASSILDQIAVLSSYQGSQPMRGGSLGGGPALSFPRHADSPPLLSQRSSAAMYSHGRAPSTLSMNTADLLSQSLSRASTNAPGALLSSYEQLLALRLHEQKSQEELALIRALQQQEEAKLRREIEYTSHRMLPVASGLDGVINMFTWGAPAGSMAPPLTMNSLSSNYRQHSDQLVVEILKKQRENTENNSKQR
jgi:hypothetical protein